MATKYIVPRWQYGLDDLLVCTTYDSIDVLRAARGPTEKLVYATVPDYFLDAAEWEARGIHHIGHIHRNTHLDTPDKPSWYVDMTNPTCGSMAEGSPREFVDWYLQHCDEHTSYVTDEKVAIYRDMPRHSTGIAADIATHVYAREKRLKRQLETGSWLECVPDMQQVVKDRDLLEALGYVTTTPGIEGCSGGCKYLTAPTPTWLIGLASYVDLRRGAELYLEWLAQYVHMPPVEDTPTTATADMKDYMRHKEAADMLADTSIRNYPNVMSTGMYLIYVAMHMFRS